MLASWKKLPAEEKHQLSQRYLAISVELQDLEERVEKFFPPCPHQEFEGGSGIDPEFKKKMLHQVERCFKQKFPEGELLNVYLGGSRWFGNARVGSDWDFVLVAKNIKQPDMYEATLQFRNVDIEDPNCPLQEKGTIDKQSFRLKREENEKEKEAETVVLEGKIKKQKKEREKEKENRNEKENRAENLPLLQDEREKFGIDISVNEVNFFKEELERHIIWAIPMATYPPAGIWLEKDTEVFKDFSVRLLTLRHAVFLAASESLGQAYHFFKSGRIKKAKKRLMFVLRYAMFCTQIAERGTVYDKAAANSLGAYCFAHRFESWVAYKSWHEKTLEGLAEKFKKVADPVREYENPLPGQLLPKGYLQTIEYIRAHGIQELPYCLSVMVTRHSIEPSLYWFNFTKGESPIATQVVRECCGLLLSYKGKGDGPAKGMTTAPHNEEWDVVCYPMHWFPSYDWGPKPWYAVEPKQISQVVDWDSARVFEKIDGRTAVLYYFKNEWRVMSTKTMDGSEKELDRENPQRTFADLFWALWKEKGYRLPDPSHKRCYVFRMIIPKLFKSIVWHEQDRLVLIGARKLTSFKELECTLVAKENGWESPEEFRFESIEEMLYVAARRCPVRHRGFVVCDKEWHRICVDSAQHNSLLRILTQPQQQERARERNIWLRQMEYLALLVDSENPEEVAEKYPILSDDDEYAVKREQEVKKVKYLLRHLEELYELLEGYKQQEVDNKELVKQMKGVKWLTNAVFFVRRSEAKTAREAFLHHYLRSIPFHLVEDWWKVRVKEKLVADEEYQQLWALNTQEIKAMLNWR